MKILYFSISEVIGGAEIVAIPWLENTKNEVVTLIADTELMKKFYNQSSELKEKKKYFIKPYEEIIGFKSKIKFYIYTFKIASYIKKIINKEKIEIIYSNNTGDYFSPIFYKIFFNKRIKIVSHIHDMINPKTNRANIIKGLASYSNIIFTPSEACKNSLINIGIKKDKIKVVYNSVEDCNNILILNNIENIIGKKKIILFVGAFNERKNGKFFIDIIKNINLIDDNYIGIMAGRIESNKYYTDIMNDINVINKKIVVLNDLNKEQINYLYSIANVLVLTSNRDPLPTVILEAMQNKLLVYSRDVDGVKEIIKDKVNGYIYPYSQSSLNVAVNLHNILNNNNNDIIIQEAYSRVTSNFSKEKKVEIIDSEIKKLFK